MILFVIKIDLIARYAIVIEFFLDQWPNESHFMDTKRIASEFWDVSTTSRAINENINNDREIFHSLFF